MLKTFLLIVVAVIVANWVSTMLPMGKRVA
jgi:hypothetical protein